MSTKKLDLIERETAGAIVIEVIGELTVANGTDQLLEKVHQKLDAGCRLLLINMAQCWRVDSSGLGELVTCLVTATRRGAGLRLTNVSSQIRGLMKMTNLHKILEVFDSEEAALAMNDE